MYQTSIETLATQTLDYFSQLGYTHNTLMLKRGMFNKIIELHKEHGSLFYDPMLVNLFIEKTDEQFKNSEFSQCKYRALTKCATDLVEFYETGSIELRRRDMSNSLSVYYCDLLDELSDHIDVSSGRSNTIWSIAKTFFKWLYAKDITAVSQIDRDVVRAYLIDCAERLSNNSFDTIKRGLKKLFLYLREMNSTTETFSELFDFPVLLEKKIKKPIPPSEIVAVLQSIDCSTSIGLRDYAIIMLATITGLRSVDIVNLKLDNIDWIKGEIKIVQSKTLNSLSLPLTKDVGLAIQNYLLYGRPRSEEKYVFLRERSPHTKMGECMPYLQFNGYREKLGLPKASFHGLRRSLGTNMVVAGIPVTTVAQVLGHTDLNSTKQYISLDSSHLKECALSFDDLYEEVSINV